MDQHPEYGLSLIKDNYNAFQLDSFNKDECSRLRSDKWKTCHPQNYDLHPCTADMTLDELKTLFNQHQSCYHFRAAENQSLCFDKPDPGHLKAEQIELHHVKQCRLLIDAKSVFNTNKTQHLVQVDANKTQNLVKLDANKTKNSIQVDPNNIQNLVELDPNNIQNSKKTKKKTKKDNTPTENQEKLESIDTCSQYIHPPFTWWVYILGIIALIGIGLFLFYVY
jgi:hypothetical protein